MEILFFILFWLVGLTLTAATAGAAVFAMLLGFVIGAIAQNKGRPFWAWSLWGMLMFILALPHILLVKNLKGPDPVFSADGNVEGVLYKVDKRTKKVTAMIDGRTVEFSSMDALTDFVSQKSVTRSVEPA